MTKVTIVWCVKRKKSMEYKKILQQQILELEQKIANSTEEKAELEKQLNKLRIAEFQEDMVEENNQVLLKG